MPSDLQFPNSTHLAATKTELSLQTLLLLPLYALTLPITTFSSVGQEVQEKPPNLVSLQQVDDTLCVLTFISSNIT